ncbi:MAG: reductive dehalogenase, partial [Dehalococcoidales bacterium]
ASLIHDVVKATAATTGIFNGFLSTMAGAFGYERHWEDTERLGAWWDRDLNTYPYDTIWK